MKNTRFIWLLVVTSPFSFADVAYLDDAALSGYTGQAGLTIDSSSFAVVREFEYLDSSIAYIEQVNVGGHGPAHNGSKPFYTDRLDNVRVQLNHSDSAASGDEFYYGFSQFRELAAVYLENGNALSEDAFKALAGGYDSTREYLAVDDKKRYAEADLVVHYNYLDAWEKDGGIEAFSQGTSLSGHDFINTSYEHAENIASRAIDFKYVISEIGITPGLGSMGSDISSLKNIASLDAGNESTRLMSNFSMQGYLGPHDLHIKHYDPQADGSSPDNGITWNSYFKVTDLDVYIDISGVQISDLQIHNNRGDLSGLNLDATDSRPGNSSFGFAHAQREIYQVKDAVLDVFNRSKEDDKDGKKKKDGIAFNTRFKGDIDINHLSFGDTGVSVGKYFITDMYFNSRLTILHR